MERVEQGRGCLLKTDEFVMPQMKSGLAETEPVGEWCNRLLYGDNLLLMEALLNGDPEYKFAASAGKNQFDLY